MYYYDIRDLLRDAYKKFRCHRRRARYRNPPVPFRFTFREWWMIWLESGHWEERGIRRGQYVMARPGDLGAYEVGNVEICTSEKNLADMSPERVSAKNKKTAQTRSKNGWRPGQTMTPEQRSVRAKKGFQTRLKKGNYLSQIFTPEQRSEIGKKSAQTRLKNGSYPFQSFTPEQRSEIGRKANQTRLKNIARCFDDLSEIEAFEGNVGLSDWQRLGVALARG
jgi:hypothetical protein